MFKKKFPSLTSLGSDGNTSFLRAARAGHLEKVLEHLRSNIDINTSNANGLNALHLASKDGHVNVVSELLKRGAIVDSATKKGNTALHIASLAGQEEVVKLLVQHGAAVNVQSQNGFTPLYMAAQENHDSVVKYLLANGANQSLATEDGFTPLAVAMQQGHDKVVAVLLENDTRGKVRLPALHIAAKKDDVKAAKLLLENEHNPDVTSKSGFTPLHIASHYGNEAIANLLIQKGADVNYAAKHNITPLHVAAKWGKTNMVALLLEKGANIESKTRDGLTPLHCAARSGHEQVVDMLLEKGAPISSKTKNGLAPLHMAAQGEHVEAARILLYHRAPVDEVTVDYLTALHVAAHCGHVRVAKLLLDRQADANARALNGFTPLHIACKKNRIKVVELLLKHGASISATTESGLTPLHVASFMGCMNIVIYLLQHEANPDVPTIRGETPLHLAARANQTDIIRILLRNGAQVDARAREQQTPLHIASRLGNVDIVMLLLQHGAQVDVTTKDMYTALHIAAKEGQDEVASVLLENNASLNATTKKGFTPLHLAAKYGNMKVAKLLLQREAAVDAQGKNGVTPLHVASHYDHQNVALLLLDKGASPHATAKNGHTPLHIAARKNQMDIATTLLEYGAKANAESKSGFTPLHLSSQEGHLDMSSLLIEHKADTNHHAKNGLTPMHLCAQEDRVNVAQVLLKNGAQVDAQTKAGYTPLHVAAHFGQANMVRFLLQNGANVNTTTGIDYTPLHQAAQQGHTHIVNILLENGANPNAITNNGQTAHNIAQKLGYITVMETLKQVTDPTATQAVISEEKYRVVAPEAMHETFMSDSEEEGGEMDAMVGFGQPPHTQHVYLPYYNGSTLLTRDYSGEDTMLSDQPYRYLTVDEMKSLGDDSLPIDVTRDELRIDSNRMVVSGDQNMLPPQAMDDAISPQHINQNYSEYTANKYMPDNIDIKHPINIGFLVSFLVDARGGAMRGCRHSGVRVIVPPRCAGMPTRITCRYVKPQRTPHPPPLMEGEALASRVLELGPVGAKFLGPVIIEVPHFAALRGKEREIVILRSDNGETWREHVIEASEDIVQDVLNESFEAEDLSQLEDISSGRITRILTHDFPQYFAVVSRIRQEVHAIGPEGGMVSSSVVPQVQAVFPQGALTKKIKVGLQAQPIDPDLTAKLLGHGVAVSPVVTVEPRRRKFHKAITLSMPAPRAHTQGMINQYSGSAPTLRLLCSITGGTTRAQWEDVTGSTPLTFVNDCVSFTTTVSARFWLMDCRNIGDATKMATELYREAIHVPFMAKFVVFAKRVDTLEARLRVFCMTDDREDKTLEHQEHFTEVAKSRDVEVLEGKPQYIEFAGNLVPVTKSGDQLQFAFRAFRENRLPFTVRVKDQHADTVGRCLFMREPKVAKGEPPQQPICVLNIVLPDNIVVESYPVTETEMLKKYGFIKEGLDVYPRTELRLSDMSNLLGEDWPALASELGLSTSQINVIKSECPDSLPQQAQSMLRLWRVQSGNKAQGNTLELALKRIGRSDIIAQCLNIDVLDQAVARAGKDQGGFDSLKDELGPSRDASLRRNISLDNTYDEQDIMKDSESIESLIQERKDSYEIDSRLRNISERDEMKYTAEEKEVQEEESGVDDAEIKKSVAERRIEIEKRLSSDREIPPSLQKHEIVQEISTIKRQSLIDDKIKYNENIIEEHVKEKVPDKVKDKDLDTEKVTKVTTTKTIVTTVDSTRKSPPKITEKTVKETITVQGKKIIPDDDIVDNELKEKLAAQKQKIELDDTKPSETTTTITKTTIVTHKVSDVDDTRRDSTLFEDVSHELERLDTTAKPQPPASEDIKSPKISKTPPPSPAEFLREQAVSENQEWSPASAAEIEKRYAATTGEIDKKTQPEGKTTSPLPESGEDKLIVNISSSNGIKNDLLPYNVQKSSDFITSELQHNLQQKDKTKFKQNGDNIKVDEDSKELNKDVKDDDNKKEKHKKGKGFFGTLKSFARKSFEHSDSESEASPIKRSKVKKSEEPSEKERKSHLENEKDVLDQIDSSKNKNIQKLEIKFDKKVKIEKTNGITPDEARFEAEKIIDNVILEVEDTVNSKQSKSNDSEIVEKKHVGFTHYVDTIDDAFVNNIDYQKLDKTKDIPSLTNEFIQNEAQFQGWNDETAKKYKPTFSTDELVDRNELVVLETEKVDENETTDNRKQEDTDDDSKLTDSESKSFFGIFSKKKKKIDRGSKDKSVEREDSSSESPVHKTNKKKKKQKTEKQTDYENSNQVLANVSKPSLEKETGKGIEHLEDVVTGTEPELSNRDELISVDETSNISAEKVDSKKEKSEINLDELNIKESKKGMALSSIKEFFISPKQDVEQTDIQIEKPEKIDLNIKEVKQISIDNDLEENVEKQIQNTTDLLEDTGQTLDTSVKDETTKGTLSSIKEFFGSPKSKPKQKYGHKNKKHSKSTSPESDTEQLHAKGKEVNKDKFTNDAGADLTSDKFISTDLNGVIYDTAIETKKNTDIPSDKISVLKSSKLELNDKIDTNADKEDDIKEKSKGALTSIKQLFGSAKDDLKRRSKDLEDDLGSEKIVDPKDQTKATDYLKFDVKNNLPTLTTEFIQNEAQFQGWNDETAEKYKPTYCPEELIDEKEQTPIESVEITEKDSSENRQQEETDDDSKLTDSESKSFFGIFSKKKKKKIDRESKEKSIEREDSSSESPSHKRSKKNKAQKTKKQTDIKGTIDETLDNSKASISDKFDASRDTIKEGSESIRDMYDETNTKSALKSGGDTFQETRETGSEMIDGSKDKTKGGLSSITGLFESAKDDLKKKKKDLSDSAETSVDGTLQDLKDTSAEKIDDAKEKSKGALSSIKGFFGSAKDDLKKKEEDLEVSTESAISEIKTKATKINVSDKVTIDTTTDKIKHDISDKADDTKHFINSDAQSTKDALDPAKVGLQKSENDVLDSTMHIVDNNKTGTKSALKSADGALHDYKDKVSEKIEEVKDKTIGGLSSIKGFIESAKDDPNKTDYQRFNITKNIPSLTTEFIQNESQFQGWNDETAEKYKPTYCLEEIIDEKESTQKESAEITEKDSSENRKQEETDDDSKLTDSESKSFFGIFSKKKKKLDRDSKEKSIEAEDSSSESPSHKRHKKKKAKKIEKHTDIKETIDKTLDASKPSVIDKLSASKDKIKEGSDIIIDTRDETQTKSPLKSEDGVDARDTGSEKLDDTKEKTKGGLSSIKGFFGSAKDDLKKKKKDLGNITETAISDIKTEASEMKVSTKETLDSTIDNSKDVIGDKVDDTTAFIKSSTENTTDAYDSAKAGLQKGASDASYSAKHVMDDITSETKSALKTVDGTLQDIKDTGSEKLDDAKEKSKGALSSIKGFFGSAKDDIKKKKKDLGDSVESTISDVKTEASELKDSTKDTLDSTIEKSEDVISDKVESTKDLIQSGAESTKGAYDSAKSSLQTGASDVSDTTKHVMEDIATETKSALKTVDGALQDVKDTGSEKIDDAKEKSKGALSSIKGFFGSAKDDIKKKKKDLGDAVESTISDVKTEASELSDSAKDTLGSTIDKSKDVINDRVDSTKDLIHSGAESTKVAYDSAKSGLQTGASDASDTTKHVFEDIASERKPAFKSVDGALQDAKGTSSDKIDDAIEKSKGTLSSIKGFLGSAKDDLEEKRKELGDSTESSVFEIKAGACEVSASAKDTFNNSFDKSKDVISKTVDSTQDLIQNAVESTKDVYDSAKSGLQTDASEVLDSSKHVKADVASVTKSALKAVDDALPHTKDAGPEKIDDSKENGSIKNIDVSYSVAYQTLEKIGGTSRPTESTSRVYDDSISVTTYPSEYIFEQIYDNEQLHPEKCNLITDLDEVIPSDDDDIQKEFSDVDRLLTSIDAQIAQLPATSKHSPSYQSHDISSFNIETMPNLSTKSTSYSEKISKSSVLDNNAKTHQTSLEQSQEVPGNIQDSSLRLDAQSNIKDVTNMISSQNIDLSHLQLESDFESFRSASKKHPVTFTRLGDNVIIDDTEYDMDSHDQGTKKKPLFHIESEERDEDDFTRGSTIQLTESTSKDCKQVSDITEFKISDIKDKNLEIELSADETFNVNKKKEQKLRRIERRFERMASETLEKDKSEAKIETPELEKKHDVEFQTIVHQMSMEEISDCQREYSALWDEGTFSPSDEMESKTPDSTAEIQEIPQGCSDIVYMAPVTFNKDQKVSKAGIEIDIIPIKKSPYSSPTFQRKSHRPKSQNDNRLPDSTYDDTTTSSATNLRASLPDIYNTKSRQISPARSAVYLPTQKLVSTFLNANKLRGDNETMSQSTECLINDNTSMITDMVSSTDSLNKGVVMSAVLSWLSQSSVFDIQDNDSIDNDDLTNSWQEIDDEPLKSSNANLDSHVLKNNGTIQSTREPCTLNESPLGGTETEQLEQDEAAGVEETEELKDEAESQTTSTRPKPAGSQHDLSEEMKALLAEMEEQSKR